MSCRNHGVVSDVDPLVRDKETRKHTITEQRREQNRRAQRAFRERRRARKEFLRSKATPRHLGPRVAEDSEISSARASLNLETEEILGWLGQISSTNTTPSSTSSHVLSYTLNPQDQQHRQRQSAVHIVQETTFTFSSPQTLLPAHDSLIPKRRSPTSVLQAFLTATNRPGQNLWPHGAPPTLAACLFNAAAMGIDIDRVGEPKYMSPFYRPSFSATLPSQSPLVQATTSYSTSPTSSSLSLSGPSSLRPCFAQVIFPHHACLDLLPLPKLRETAIMLVVRREQQHGQCAVDSSSNHDEVQELKRDVYVRQGVRFRGTGDLTREEYVLPGDESTRHCGNPWERGSWAIAPWFAFKWKHLMDL